MSAATNRYYRPDIDGLRAVAVLSVIIYHAGFTTLPGGYVGVDVFFVISGYLITSIISRELKADRFSILDFWERRVRRIVPPLAIVLLFSIAAAWLTLFPNDFRGFSQSLIAQSIFASNIFFWTQTGYFATASELKPLLHTWSLAIEEQFYLLLPLLLILMRKRTDGLRSFVIAAVIAASLAISMHWVSQNPPTAFFWLPARAWELLMGSILVFLPKPGSSARLWDLCSALGLALILYACLSYNEETRFPGLSALLPCLGTALVIHAHASGKITLTYRLLSLKPIVYTGLISYSLYLWHWPLFVFAKYHASDELPLLTRLGLIALSFVLAALSLRFVETPIRSRAVLSRNTTLISASAALFCFCVSVGVIGHFSKGFPNRLDPAVLEMYSGHLYTNPKRTACLFSEKREFDASQVCRVGSSHEDADKIDFIMVGDSHANSLFPLIENLAEQNDVSGLLPIYNGCPPVLTVYRVDSGDNHKCHEFNQQILELIKRESIKHVLLVGRWSFYTDDQVIDQTDDNGDRPGNWLIRPAPSKEESRQLVEAGLTKFIAQIDNTTTVQIVKQVPEQNESITPRFLASRIMQGDNLDALPVNLTDHLARQANAQSMLDAVMEKTSREIQFIDVTPYLCDDNACAITRDGGSLYRDGDHISTYGSFYFAEAFDQFFKQMK